MRTRSPKPANTILKPPPPLMIGDAESAHPATARKICRSLGPWGSSAFLHVALLFLLLVWSIPLIQRGTLDLTAFTGTDANKLDDLALNLEDHDLSEIEVNLESDDFTEQETQPVEIELILPESVTHAPQPEVTVELAPKPTFNIRSESSAQAPTVGASGSIHGVSSIEDAVDRVTGGIRGQLENGDVLVVWLLDSSRSLEADRPRVAKRLGKFLQAIEAESEQRPYQLLNTVVAFGAGVRERISPTSSTKKVLATIQNTPIDTSGKENIFSTVEKSVVKYRKKWKEQMMVVIWTDESGDDTSRLETTIKLCKQHEVSVSTIGPSAVIGAKEAMDTYTDPKTGIVYPLPVARGPEAAMPERLRLGYWHRMRRPRGFHGPDNRRFPAWHGGEHLISLSSGFSPYALTRLSLATGGSFTIFDHPDDRPPFDVLRMQDYLPTYGPVKEYARDVQSHHLRESVLNAVKATYGSETLGPPQLMFFGDHNPAPPYKFEPLFFSPMEFGNKLRGSRNRLIRGAKHTAIAVEFALKQVSQPGNPEFGLDDEYDTEQAPRWRAWYDLTRGRLLATSVRLEEYRLLCEKFGRSDFLANGTNCIMVGSSPSMESTGPFPARADEAQRLLERCVAQNPDTPWAYLAERELAHGLGLQVRQLTLQPGGPVKSRNTPKLPNF